MTQLTQQITDNPWNYAAHVELISVVQRGFVAHLQFPDSTGQPREPGSYNLLTELRQARLAMDSRFPVGEDLWLEWLRDECVLASKTEERIAVMELCQKAVQDEAGSAKLWQLYADWMWVVYKRAHNIERTSEDNLLETEPVVEQYLKQQIWTEEEKLVAEEVFTWDLVLDVWRQGIRATQWHINDSNLLWDGYMEVLMYDLSRVETTEKIQYIGKMFDDRLAQPHATWDDTFQKFSQYVSQYHNKFYEDIMVSTTQRSAPIKQEYTMRQEYEQALRRASDTQDKDVEYNAFREYLDWEIAQSKKKKTASPHSFDLIIGLAERANLRFPADLVFWEDHIALVTEAQNPTYPLLIVAERAVRHCPWSGDLWTKRLYAVEAINAEFEQIEDVKHRATATGLLEEIGGLEELLKVHIAWCGFLRRRAFAVGAGEDEIDMAEVGIRSAIENVKEIGVRKYGKDFKDPGCRTEKIYCKFLAQAGRFEEARAYWRKMITSHKDFAQFWERYYLWEMIVWGIDLARARSTGQPLHSPAFATSVLEKAIDGSNLDTLDWPEKMLEAYKNHCAQHETVHKLQDADVRYGRAVKKLAARRERERIAAEESAAAAAAATAYEVPDHSDEGVYGSGLSAAIKRKREDDTATNDQDLPKRARGGDAHDGAASDLATSSGPGFVKRDRENSSIVVTRLPAATTETRIRQYFRDVGYA